MGAYYIHNIDTTHSKVSRSKVREPDLRIFYFDTN